MRRLLKIEWGPITGVLAAVTAIIPHFLHVIDTGVLSGIPLVIITSVVSKWG